MFAMFNHIFRAIGVLFQALESFATAFLFIAKSAEIKAQAFSEETSLDAQRDLDRIQAQYEQERAARATPILEQK